MSDVPYAHLPLFRSQDIALVEIEVRDISTEDTALLDPSHGVTITVLGPNGESTATTKVPMQRVSRGVYQYQHPILPLDASGVYSAEIVATHGSIVQQSAIYGLFKVL